MHLEVVGEFFGRLVESSIQASILAAGAYLLIRLLGSQLTSGWRCVLWSLVLLRLAWPFVISTPFNLLPVPRKLEEIAWVSAVNETLEPLAFLPFLGLLWAVGAGILTLRLLGSLGYAAWLLRDSRPMDSWRLCRLLQACKQKLGITECIPIHSSHRIQSPCIAGVLSPRLILPKNYHNTLSDIELRLILIHELTHFRNRDNAMNWVLAFVEIIHWFNPLVRLACDHYRDERESVCDASALTACPGSNKIYGRMLLRCLSAGDVPPAAAFANKMLGDSIESNALVRRFHAIASFRVRKNTWILGLLAAGTFAFLGFTEPVRESVVEAPYPPLPEPVSLQESVHNG